MPRARYIPELLRTHAEDLAFVWGWRRHALNSPAHTQRDYADLSERLEAHVQGLLCAPPQDLLERLGPALATADADESFAAAYALLRTREPGATKAVVVAFSGAGGQALQGLREALSSAAPALFADEMSSALQHANPATAAAAAAVLASHRLLPSASVRLGQLLEDDDAATVALAWRAAMLADHNPRDELPSRPYWLALSHKDPAVRDAGWAAVTWAGQATAKPHAAQLCGRRRHRGPALACDAERGRRPAAGATWCAGAGERRRTLRPAGAPRPPRRPERPRALDAGG